MKPAQRNALNEARRALAALEESLQDHTEQPAKPRYLVISHEYPANIFCCDSMPTEEQIMGNADGYIEWIIDTQIGAYMSDDGEWIEIKRA